MFQEAIIEALKRVTGLKAITLERPKDLDHGDFAFPCFPFAKSLKKDPAIIAADFKARLEKERLQGVERIETIGPYLNFFLNRKEYGGTVIGEIRKLGTGYGKGKDRKKTYMMEFFHANTHKGVHIGHIRNISLGESLSRIHEHAGYNVKRVNYQGDIGPHVTKCLWGYLNNRKGKPPKERRGVWLGRIYAEANKIITGNDALEKEVRVMTKRLYDHDPELVKLWKETRQWCLEDFDTMYKDFKVKYDRLYFESEVEGPGKLIVQDMMTRGIARESDGATIMDLEDENLGVYVLLRDDGVALYHTKDLGLAALKCKEFKVDRSIHVVGKEQELYFKQLFKTFERIGSPMAGKSYHLIYELVMLPEGKMSSREGNVVWYEDLLDRLLALAEEEIKKRHADWDLERVRDVGRQIAFGALKFGMVNRDNLKAMVFDWDQAMDFEGETGPYLQYSHARINSLFRKFGQPCPEKADYALLEKESERRIINHLALFPSTIDQTASSKKTVVLSRYLLDLAQAWNEYYHEANILKEEQPLRDARLHLADAIGTVFKVGMGLFAIDLPEQM